ncbi:L-ascorbate peroxidase 3 [Glycine max]|nr:L-ascorbate peroxidase 3 [Glycine max]
MFNYTMPIVCIFKIELLRGESKDLLKLPTDKALVEDPNFRKYVELYAKMLFSQIMQPHTKNSELGFIFRNHRSILAKGVTGIAIVLTAVILGYLPLAASPTTQSQIKQTLTMAEPVVDDEYLKEIDKARRELRAFITSNQCAPLMLRLAWNDAATYDARNRAGGPNGSIRTDKELKHEANEGLLKATQLCEHVKAKLKKVSYADLYQLAGVVAIEVSGGPTIEFLPGRKDSMESSAEGLLPDVKQGASIIRNIFSRMGISDDKHIVALCGGLTWGETLKDRSDSKGQWPKDPLKFDNSYYKKILSKDLSSRLPIEDALLTDQSFRRHVEEYSKDENSFFKEYAMSHKKLSELGYNLKKQNQSKVADEEQNQPKGPYEKLNQHRGLIGIGIVSVVTVILGYLLKRKKNQLKK